MRIIACLSWYDERVDWLAELVASLARATIDHVVAVDGAYALYPGAHGTSSSEQADTIAATARALGIGTTIHAPQMPWVGNEVAKRDALFRLAHAIADPGDWLWVIDGDELIVDAGDARSELEGSNLDAAEVLLRERQADGDVGHALCRKLFRAQPGGIRVQGNHQTYVTADDVVLRGNERQVAAEQLYDVRVEHRPLARHVPRLAAKATYYRVRDSLEVEHAVA